MSIDYRALCAELLNALTTTNPSAFGKFVALEDRARAALAEPVAEGPTDEEVEAWAGDQGFIRGHGDHPCGFWIDDGDAGAFARAVLARYGHQPAERVATPVGPTDEDLLHIATVALTVSHIKPADIKAETELYLYGREVVEVARAALARYGHQPAPPAAGADCPACEGVPKPGNQPCAACGRSASSAGGEVAELAWWLRSLEDASVWFETGSPEALKLTRAADLLEQRHPAPVPVSERLPGPEDCDAKGRCWLHLPDMGTEPLWRLTDPSMRSRYHSHWLPATALPLPQGEGA